MLPRARGLRTKQYAPKWVPRTVTNQVYFEPMKSVPICRLFKKTGTAQIEDL